MISWNSTWMKASYVYNYILLDLKYWWRIVKTFNNTNVSSSFVCRLIKLLVTQNTCISFQLTEKNFSNCPHQVKELVHNTWPFLPAHSISKLRILKGAIADHSPSGTWDIKSSQETSTSIWQRDLTGNLGSSFVRMRYFPAGISIQLHPTTSVSTINL